MRLVTFVKGPFSGEVRPISDPGCEHHGQVMTINAFLAQELQPTGYWLHILAEYEINGDKAIFNKLVSEPHAHKYSLAAACACDEPGF